MSRRLLWLFFVVVVGMALSACGSNGGTGDGQGHDGGGEPDAQADLASVVARASDAHADVDLDARAPGARADALASSPDHAAAALGTFTAMACPFPPVANRRIECGTVAVPEGREPTAAGRAEVAVAIFKSAAATPAPDPLVYLEGGPGASSISTMLSLARVRSTAANPLDAFLAKRDVIAIDQRGLGLSRPSLDCPELTTPAPQQPMMMGVGDLPEAASVQRCRDRLRASAVDPGRYRTEAAADDIEDVRRALGHSQWNLLGASYGSRLALEVIRRHPEGLRAVILDSVLPPQVDWLAEVGPNIEGSLNLVFDSCAKQAACNRAYPKLREVFLAVAANLDAKPALISNGSGGQVMLTGKLFLGLMSRFLTVPLLIRELPDLTFQLRDGNYTFFEQLFGALASMMPSMMQGGLNFGLHLSVVCGNNLPFTSVAAIDARAATISPALREALTPRFYFDLCRVWDVPAAPPTSKDPVSSPIKTLLLSGEYDPATPPPWAVLAGKSLSSAHTLELKGESHGIFPTACGKTLVVDFLQDPSKAPAPPCFAALKDLTFAVRR